MYVSCEIHQKLTNKCRDLHKRFGPPFIVSKVYSDKLQGWPKIVVKDQYQKRYSIKTDFWWSIVGGSLIKSGRSSWQTFAVRELPAVTVNKKRIFHRTSTQIKLEEDFS